MPGVPRYNRGAMRSFLLSTVLACAIAACGKDRDRCVTEVTELTRYMQGFDLRAGPFVQPARLVVRPVTEPAPLDLVLVLAPSGAQFGGQPVTPETLGKTLAERSASTRSALLLAIDEAMRWDEIVPFLQASADAGLPRVAFAFEPPPSGEPPQATELDARLERAGSSRERREAVLEDAIRTTFKACEKVSHLIYMTSAATGDNPSEVVVNGIGRGLLDCECAGVDFASARSIAWHLFHRPGARVLTVKLAKEGAPLAYAGATPWQQIGPQLTARGAVWPSVAP